MTDSVILTGGLHSNSRVQEYNLQGSVARLPDLNTGRYIHACGHYTHNGEMVSKYYFSLTISINCHMCGAGVYSHRRMDWFCLSLLH